MTQKEQGLTDAIKTVLQSNTKEWFHALKVERA